MTSERKLHSATRFLPWVVLVAMLGVTWVLWDHERQTARNELRTQFGFALRDTVSRIEQREAAYEQMLLGVRGLFAATDLMNHNAVRDYVETLQLDANFSGIKAVGVIKWVPSRQKAAHIADMRGLGLSDYAISPSGERDGYAPIIQSVPDLGRGVLLGVDPWVDPVRRQAMEKARDSGMPAITGKVRLAGDNGIEAPPGFIMFLPIFSRNQTLDSVFQRRASLIGWVYTSFHMNDFMASLYGRQASGLRLSIYDETNTTDSALMYRTGGTVSEQSAIKRVALSANEYMVLAGHTWTLSLSAQDEFEARFGRDVAPIVAVTGIGLSLSMALLVWFMVTGRDRALRLAAEMTIELRHMAQHDSLTELPNRALFSDRVQQKLANAQRRGEHVAMIFIDLDSFKFVNDNYGHAVGDLLLQNVAARLQESIRASDTAGRLGGDEFVILMGELSEVDTAARLAEKIRQAVAQPYSLNTA